MDDMVVAPAKIETELERIWDSLQGTNKMRACLFNLIIYSKKDERVEYLRSVAKKIIKRFPSRILFIELDPKGSEDKLETSVSVMTADEGSSEIVCDLINITASRSYIERVPFVVLPHILPDLPIYLLYGDDPTKNDPVSKQIERFATRIIFDSETSDQLSTFSKAVLAHKEMASSDIADLNWARIQSWRELIIDHFHTAEKLEQLKRITALHIHYNDIECAALCHTRVQAVYLQGWLASQLNWVFKKQEEGKTFYYEQCTVYLHPTKVKSLPSGRLISVEIETSQEEHVSFKRHLENARIVSIEVSTQDTCLLPTQILFDIDETGQSLVREVTHRGTSEHYLKLLRMLSTMDPHL